MEKINVFIDKEKINRLYDEEKYRNCMDKKYLADYNNLECIQRAAR